MNSKLIVFLFIFQINLLATFPSDDIWNKIKKYINQGKMIVNKNKTHFIFDETNYTKLDINSTKMQDLYKRQEQIFQETKMANYIIIVDNLDESIESINKAEGRLERHIEKEFKFKWNRIFIIFISVKSRRITIKIGNRYYREGFTIFKYWKILNQLKSYFKQKQYYEAWMYLLDEFYSKFKFDNFCFKCNIWLSVII